MLSVDVPEAVSERLNTASARRRFHPFDDDGFWVNVLLFEFVGDDFNQAMRAAGEGAGPGRPPLHPSLVGMGQVHTAEEARHIAYARRWLHEGMPALTGSPGHARAAREAARGVRVVAGGERRGHAGLGGRRRLRVTGGLAPSGAGIRSGRPPPPQRAPAPR
jgi:hypothetical protein